MAFFQVTSGGILRTIHYEGDTQAKQAVCYFDGGTPALGSTFLQNHVTRPVAGTLRIAPDDVNRNGWTEPWSNQTGYPDDTDLKFLHALPGLVRARFPSVERVYAAGHSGGGGVQWDYLARLGELGATASAYKAHGISKFPMVLAHVNPLGEFVGPALPPVAFWWGVNDPKWNSPNVPPAYITIEETIGVLVKTLDAVPSTPKTVNGITATKYGAAPLRVFQDSAGHGWNTEAAETFDRVFAQLAGFVLP